MKKYSYIPIFILVLGIIPLSIIINPDLPRSVDYSFRLNDRMYRINDESLGSTLGDFLELNTITFSNKSERLGTNGVMFFLADHDQFGEACYRFICPYLINLVKLVNRDLIAVDFLFNENSDAFLDLEKDETSGE